MASRADLIMAQVRGELAQINREKASTGNFIDDITAGVLGYQTGKEAMEALESGIESVQEFRDNKYQRQSARTDRRQRRVNRRMDRMDAREQRIVDAIDMSIPDFEEEDTIYESTPGAFQTEGSQRALDRMEFDTFTDNSANNVYESDFSNMDAPMIKPDRPMVKSTFTEEPEMLPNIMTDEEKLPITMNLKDEINRATELYLGGTMDIYATDMGTFNTTFSESTGYNYSNVNLSDMPEAQYDLEAVKSTQAAAGVTGFFTGRSQEEITDKQDDIATEAINKLTTG
jgi:hypothetical protein